MFTFAAAPPRRRMSLTPMIDVVFLLLVFFMLAARFGLEGSLALTLGAAGEAQAWQGPPRLVEVAPGAVLLNGVVQAEAGLAEALAPLMDAPGDPVLIRARDGADLQRLVAVMERLQDAGIARLVLVE